MLRRYFDNLLQLPRDVSQLPRDALQLPHDALQMPHDAIQMPHDASLHTDHHRGIEDLLNRLDALWTKKQKPDRLHTRLSPHPPSHPPSHSQPPCSSHPPSPSPPLSHPHPTRTSPTLMLQRVVRALGGVRVHMCASGGGDGGDEGTGLCFKGVRSALVDQMGGDQYSNI